MKPTETKSNHVILDGKAAADILTNANRLHAIIDGQFTLHEIKAIHRHTHVFDEDENGVSMIYILDGGHCNIHTCPKSGTYFLDLLIGEEHNTNASATAKTIAELLDGPFTMRTINRKMQEVTVE